MSVPPGVHMTEQMHSHAGMANQVGAGVCPESGTMMRLITAARALWPHKPAAELAVRTGYSERMCKYLLARRYSVSVDALADLLRSEDGLVFLEAMMVDAHPVWWKGFKRKVQLAETKRRLNELRRELDRLDQEEDD